MVVLEDGGLAKGRGDDEFSLAVSLSVFCCRAVGEVDVGGHVVLQVDDGVHDFIAVGVEGFLGAVLEIDDNLAVGS